MKTERVQFPPHPLLQKCLDGITSILDEKSHRIPSSVAICGYDVVVAYNFAKVEVWVRFPLAAFFIARDVSRACGIAITLLEPCGPDR
jgi:hypothetical protein